jgi:hypothetical protein
MSDLVTAWALVASLQLVVCVFAALAYAFTRNMYEREGARRWFVRAALSPLWPVVIPAWLVVMLYRAVRWAWSE